MQDLMTICLVCFGCFLFWQQRRQAEIARQTIERKCRQLELQVVSITFKHRLVDEQRRWRWHTRYTFEFSSLGDDCYEGYLDMIRFSPAKFFVPVHRL
ncbi:DUF3301 domain-containing protein [Vibrio spartinae]|nr:DUF3301 domain-containing protein [Vibrio spartinae]